MVIGACGLICSECEAYKATQANDPAAIESVAAKWREEYGAPVQADYVWCDGCMTEGSRKCGHCAECDIRTCVTEKAIANCAACTDYPCAKIAAFTTAVPQAKATLDSLRT